jgi:hypothetical protein
MLHQVEKKILVTNFRKQTSHQSENSTRDIEVSREAGIKS